MLHTGRGAPRDPDRALRLIDADERLWSFSKRELRSYDHSKASTMPSARGILAPREVDDLIAYLFTLRNHPVGR